MGELGVDEGGVLGAFLDFGYVVLVEFVERVAVAAGQEQMGCKFKFARWWRVASLRPCRSARKPSPIASPAGTR